jgi:hypothetical protein
MIRMIWYQNSAKKSNLNQNMLEHKNSISISREKNSLRLMMNEKHAQEIADESYYFYLKSPIFKQFNKKKII